jgi:uncharacterized protein (TIGR03437 family)
VAVEYGGERLVAGVDVVASKPGIFTLNGSGSGQAAVLNQDGSINSPRNPADPGSVVSLFLTGTGQTSPPSVEGEIARDINVKPLNEFASCWREPTAV